MLHGIASLLKKSSPEVVDAMTRQVAEQSVEDVCQRVATHMDGMTLSEARGYIRARAAGIVRRQTRLAISRNPGTGQDIAEVVARSATERILPTVLRRTGVGVPRALELPAAA